MSAGAAQRLCSLSRLLRKLAWLLSVLVATWTASSRLIVPAAAALTASYTAADRACNPDTPADCQDSEMDDSEVECDSDPETEEVPTVPDSRLWLARVATSELWLAYSGKPRPGFSSVEPRPAEQV